MIAAVADYLHHAAIRPRQPHAHRHAAAEAEPAACEAHISLGPWPREVLLQGGPVADGFVDQDVVLRQSWVQGGECCGMLRSIELTSATRIPQARASRSSRSTACGLRPR